MVGGIDGSCKSALINRLLRQKYPMELVVEQRTISAWKNRGTQLPGQLRRG